MQIWCLLILLSHNMLSFGQVFRNRPKPTPYHDWDYLIFSQRWPLTACSQWEEKSNSNTCNLPNDKKTWTVHGIWPTKTGTLGPLFCPSAIHFNPDQLAPIMDDLKNYWTNTEANTKPNSFWAHEWNKHGTCASILPQFDSVPNYFRMGLKFNQQYNIYNILSDGHVVPNSDGYDIGFIYSTIKNAIRQEPAIECVTDSKTKESLISEIRICFNKSLDLIDCTPSNPIHRRRYGLNTNCNQKTAVKYIPVLPTEENSKNDLQSNPWYRTQDYYLRFYSILKAIIWFTF